MCALTHNGNTLNKSNDTNTVSLLLFNFILFMYKQNYSNKICAISSVGRAHDF